MRSETPHTVKTAAGAIYRKSDIAESKIDTSDFRDKSPKKDQSRRSPHGDEPKSKTKKIDGGTRETNSDSEEMTEIQESSEMENAAALYQDSQQNVTSKDIELNGGPVLGNASSSETKGARKRTKN